ncbi:MAG: M61 family metallopeptidase [Gammaproteobacteria bacterium]|nr:M61 family metallopeptidase [Gammaproteobacteria bacterium]NVK87907.1 M61 family metallopeptidase [Gammaproteobacteria bacterium]
MSKFSLLMLSLCFVLALDASQEVVYRVEIEQPQHHLARIEVAFPAHSEQSLTVSLPVWRTGRYEVLDLSNGMRSFSAKDAKGVELSWQRQDKATWIVQSNGKPVTVSYLIYANEIGNRTRHIDDTHAYLDATATFVYSPSLRDLPVRVKLDVPRKWRSRSGMNSPRKHTFIAANYDILVDSPIETGIHSFHEFSVAERDYELLFWGRGNYDEQAIKTDLAKLDREVEKIWRRFPYSRYVYMIHATSGPRGATEHINSTVIQRQRDKFGAREDYIEFLTTAAHELVHTWNVKAYRPAALVPYRYQAESYTPLLWVAEGSTSYFDTLLVRRAGISTQAEFHKDLAKSIERLLNRPGTEVQSVAEASFYSWIESTNDFTINHGVNIYAKGSMVSWLLDYKIREATDNERSYEDVHRLLFERFNAVDKGFTDADLTAIVNEVTGQDFSDFWRDYVWGVKPLPINDMLSFYGLQVTTKKPQPVIDLGLTFDDEKSGLVVSRVRRGSTAWQAGLTTEDRIVAFDKLRVTKKNIKQRTEALTAGESITVQFFRRDELQEVTLKVTSNAQKELQVIAVEQPSSQQQQHYQSWTGHALTSATEAN